MVKVLFCGTPDFAVAPLQVIHQQSDFQVVGVVTQPDRAVGRGLNTQPTPVKRMAISLKIPVFQPEKASDPEFIETIRKLQPDVMVVVAYGQILKKALLDIPPLGCVNIHASLLPRWRGAAPIQYSIWKGDDVTGITTMKMVPKLDAGAMYHQVMTPIAPTDDGQTLHDRLAQMGASLIVRTLNELKTGQLVGVEQDEAQVTYASKIEKEQQWLNPSASAKEWDHQIRAFFPWPGTAVQFQDLGRVKILKASMASGLYDRSNQKLGLYSDGGMLVLRGDSGQGIQLEMIQPEGKKPMKASEWMNGWLGGGRELPLRWIPQTEKDQEA